MADLKETGYLVSFRAINYSGNMNEQNGVYPQGPLSLLRDAVFKAVFTKDTAQSKGALRALLSVIIDQELDIIDLLPNEPPIDDIHDRQIRYDIHCIVRDTREPINIEMTLYPDSFEEYRLEFHASKLFCSQDIRGKDKDFGDLKRCYQISLFANYGFISGKPMFSDEHFFHSFEYYDPEHKTSLGGQIRIITIELYKLDKIAEKIVAEMSKKERWAVFFEYHEVEEKSDLIQELIRAEEGIAMAQEVYSGITQDQYEQARLMGIFKNQMDIQSIKVEAKREREARIKAEQEQERAEQALTAERERAKQERERSEQVRQQAIAAERERSEQALAAERERVEQVRQQAIAAERERSEQVRQQAIAAERERAEQVRQQAIAAMRELGLSDKDIDRIYPET
ncbi:Rpn family recombination-promoting nuclease/putative transposase [Breznakiellaceae bacterium SP9]